MTITADHQARIEELYASGSSFEQEDRELVQEVLAGLNQGTIRVVQKITPQGGAHPRSGEEASPLNGWEVLEWVKKAILLSFRMFDNHLIEGAPFGGGWYDKVASRYKDYTKDDFSADGVRVVPPTYVRHGSYVAPGVILMPSFVNIGAYIGSGTMIDSWVTVGSCAQVGRNCHIAVDTCLGGVLEPLQASPVIVEDNCFIGAGSKILEGVIIKENSVLGAGTIITASTKIVDRSTGDFTYGVVPAGSVVVPGSLNSGGSLSLACAVIVKKVDAQVRAKTSVNELLRS